MGWESIDEKREGQEVGGEEDREVDNFMDAALSLEIMSDCFWVRLPRAFMVAARSEMSVEEDVLRRVEI